tara:strand:+ start:130 stop:345 length:216 start_codon:yes stop_codon:yes gene_type:complete
MDLYEEERLEAPAFSTNFYPVFFNDTYKDPDELVMKEGITVLKEALLEAQKNREVNMTKVRLWKSLDNRQK